MKLNEKHLAEIFSVSIRTIANWKADTKSPSKKHKAAIEAVKRFIEVSNDTSTTIPF